jgi:hypothetical protein
LGEELHHDAQHAATGNYQGNHLCVHHRSPPMLTTVIAVRLCSVRLSFRPGRGLAPGLVDLRILATVHS